MREQTKRTEIYKRALFLAVPMMIQNGITNMVGLVDNVMVGKLGTESMTAVSIVGQLIFVLTLQYSEEYQVRVSMERNIMDKEMRRDFDIPFVSSSGYVSHVLL